MIDDQIAALERLVDAYESDSRYVLGDADAATLRAHIADLQNGGERAKVVALLDAMAEQHITRDMKHKTPQDEGAFEALARAAIRVKAGAHLDGGDDERG